MVVWFKSYMITGVTRVLNKNEGSAHKSKSVLGAALESKSSRRKKITEHDCFTCDLCFIRSLTFMKLVKLLFQVYCRLLVT